MEVVVDSTHWHPVAGVNKRRCNHLGCANAGLPLGPSDTDFHLNRNYKHPIIVIGTMYIILQKTN